MRAMKNILLYALLIAMTIAFNATPAFANGVNGTLMSGKKLIEEGKYVAAIQELKKTMEAGAVSGEVYFLIGKAYNRIKENELALNYFAESTVRKFDTKVLAFEMGLAYEKLGYYEDAIELFKISAQNTDEVGNSNYKLGQAYHKILKYDEATKSFDKAISADETLLPRAQLYKGIIKFEQKSYDEALFELKTAKKTAVSDVTKASAKNYISAVRAIKRATRDHSLDGALSFVYDDNVATVNDTEAVSISDKSDIGGVAYIRGIYCPIKTKENTLSIGYMFYQKLYQDMSAYNLQDHSGLLTYSTLLGEKTTLSLQYDYNYYFLDSEKYFQKHRLKPIFRFQQNRKSYFDFRLLADYKDYFAENTLDANNFGFGFTQSQTFKSGARIYFSLDFNKENTNDDDYDYRGRDFKIGVSSYPLFLGIDANLSVGFLKKSYKNVHSVYDVSRDDEVKTCYVSLKKELNDFITASLGYDFTFNDSNIIYYDYKRNVATIEFKFIY